ncbi:MAG: hypothetical protein AAGD22_03880 [Verrucomicrobiota bacterium]
MSDPGDRGGLTFDWTRQRGTHRRLGVFVLLSASVHAFGFYLFQVVYPQPERFSPVPARVTRLVSDEPAVRGVLRGVEDRVVYFDTGLRETAPAGGLGDLTLPYVPSYAGYLPKLRKPPVDLEDAEVGMVPLELPDDLKAVGKSGEEGEER